MEIFPQNKTGILHPPPKVKIQNLVDYNGKEFEKPAENR